jgi:hypothetical protein
MNQRQINYFKERMFRETYKDKIYSFDSSLIKVLYELNAVSLYSERGRAVADVVITIYEIQELDRHNNWKVVTKPSYKQRKNFDRTMRFWLTESVVNSLALVSVNEPEREIRIKFVRWDKYGKFANKKIYY